MSIHERGGINNFRGYGFSDIDDRPGGGRSQDRDGDEVPSVGDAAAYLHDALPEGSSFSVTKGEDGFPVAKIDKVGEED